MTKESDAECLLKAGMVLNEARKCGCDICTKMIISTDSDFLSVSTRFARIKKTNPGLLFKMLAEEWGRERILTELPELYS